MRSTLLLAFVSAGVMLLNKVLSGVWIGAHWHEWRGHR